MYVQSSMEFEWDSTKARTNKAKHKVEFADATGALFDECAVTIRDEGRSEERYVTVGMDTLGRVLVVAYTWRGERIRLISARRATPAERRQYEEG